MKRFHLFLPALVFLLLTVRAASAAPITLTTTSVPSFALAPSADTLELDGGSVTFDPASSAPFVFQTGVFQIGDSGDLVQNIPFSAQETVTIDGVTQMVTISGEDDITTSWDTLQIYESGPIAFGNYLLTIAPFTIADSQVGDNDPIALDGSVVAVTPEPESLVLLGTGVAGFAAVAVRRMRAGRGSSATPA